MADSEFEEFKKYFDRLPQYIKAPPDSYTLVHLDDDSTEDGIAEPFAGDLEVIEVKTQYENTLPVTTRKRRKLPEIPKNPVRKWDESTHQISLAEELSNADIKRTTEQISSKNGIFILKFDESSPSSSSYPSLDLDSGNSTIHSRSGSPCSHLELLEATHRGLHRFVPRHHDEIEVQIGDPIYVFKEADDLWCEGVNLRTGLQGIFPSAHVVDVDYTDFDPNLKEKVRKERYLLNYVGSIETHYHKGNQVLTQAVAKMKKQAHKGRPCILEISDKGIHMLDKGNKVASDEELPSNDYFYSLKNVSFAAFHPTNQRYFGFVTKHPTLNRFACHVYVSEESTRPVAEAVGRAFQRFYRKFLEAAYPIEDIYLE